MPATWKTPSTNWTSPRKHWRALTNSASRHREQLVDLMNTLESEIGDDAEPSS